MDKDNTQEQSQKNGAPLQHNRGSKPGEPVEQDSKVQALHTASDVTADRKQGLTDNEKDEPKEKPIQAARKPSAADTTRDTGAAQQPSPSLTARDTTTLPEVTEELKQTGSQSVQSSDSAASRATYPKADGQACVETPAAAAGTGASDVRHDQNAASSVTPTKSSDSAVPSQQSASSEQRDESEKQSGPPANVLCGQAESVRVGEGSLVDQFSSTEAQEGEVSDLSSVPSNVSPVDSSRKMSTDDVKDTSSSSGDLQTGSCDKPSEADKKRTEETGKTPEELQPNQGSEVPQATETTGRLCDTGHVQPGSRAEKQPSSVTTEPLVNRLISSQEKPEKVPSATSQEGGQPSATEVQPKSSISPPVICEELPPRIFAEEDKEVVSAVDEDWEAERVKNEAAGNDTVPGAKPPKLICEEDRILPRQASLSGVTEASVPGKAAGGESRPGVYIPQRLAEEDDQRSMDIYSKLQDEIEKIMQDGATPESCATSAPEQIAAGDNKRYDHIADKGEDAGRTGEEAVTTKVPDETEAVTTVDGSAKKGSASHPAEQAPKVSNVKLMDNHEAKLKEDGIEKVDKEKEAPAGDQTVKTDDMLRATDQDASEPDKLLKHLESVKLRHFEEDQKISHAPAIEKDKGSDENKLAPSGDEKTEAGTASQKESLIAKRQEEVIADEDTADSETKRVMVPSEDVQTGEEKHDVEKAVPEEHEVGKEESKQEKHAKDAETNEIPAKDEKAYTEPEPSTQETSKKEHPEDEQQVCADSKETGKNKDDVTMLAGAEKSSPSIKETASTEEKEVSQEDAKESGDVRSVTAENGASAKDAAAVSEEKPSREVAQTEDTFWQEKKEEVVREDNEVSEPKVAEGGKADEVDAKQETQPDRKRDVDIKEDSVSGQGIECPHEIPQDGEKVASVAQEEMEASTEETHESLQERPSEAHIKSVAADAEGVAEQIIREEESKEERKGACDEDNVAKGNAEKVEEPQEAEPPAEGRIEAKQEERSEQLAHEVVPESTGELQETVVAAEAAAEIAKEAFDVTAAAPDEAQETKDTEEGSVPPTAEKEAEAGEDVQRNTSTEEPTADAMPPAVPNEPPAEAAPSEVEAVSDVASASREAAEMPAAPPPPADTKKKSAPRSPSKRVSTKIPPKTLEKKETPATQDANARAPTSPKKPGTVADKGSSSPKKTVLSKNGVTSPSKTAAKMLGSEQKKLPPIKAPVGQAPRPDLKNVRSKIGSLDNIKHKPKGGEVKVQTQKLEWRAAPKVGSLDNASHKPGGGDKKILSQKLGFKAQPKVGSLDNVDHKPAGGQVKVETQKLEFKQKATPKIGSLDNVKHKPGGGAVKIVSEKLDFKERASSKIGSLSTSDVSSNRGSETQSPIQAMSPPQDGSAAAVAANGHEGDSDISPTKEEDNNIAAPEQPISPAAPPAAEVAEC